MTKQTSPRAKRRARTRQAILEAAHEIIREQGPEGLSMRELATRIEYSPSGLYEYFDSKETLINAVCDEGFVSLSARLARVPTTLAPAERLIEAGLAYLDFATSHPEEYRLMFGTTPSKQAAFEEINQSPTYEQLKQIIREGLALGVFKERPDFGLEELTYYNWALVHGMAMLRLTLFQHSGPEIDQLNRHVLTGAIVNLKAP